MHSNRDSELSVHTTYLADKLLSRKSSPIPKPPPHPPRLSLPTGPNSYYSKPGHHDVLSTTTNSCLIPSRHSMSKVKPGQFPPPTTKLPSLQTPSVDNVSTTSHTSQPSHFPPPTTKPPPPPKQLATSATTYTSSSQPIYLPPLPAMPQSSLVKSAVSTTNCANLKKRSFSMTLPPAVKPKPTGHHTYDMLDDSQKVQCHMEWGSIIDVIA